VVSKAEHATHELESELEKPEPKKYLRTVARAGLVSRAAIYVVFGVLAYLIVASGRSPSQASGSGALAEVAKQPAGPFLVGILSAGLLCYAGWRLAQAIAGVEPPTADRLTLWKRLGWLVIAIVYFVLFAEAVSILIGSGASSGPANHPQVPAATVLSWTGGQFILGLVASGLVAGSVSLAVWACVHDYGRVLDEHRAPAWVHLASRVTGIVGNLARAALLALVASYTFLAAFDDAPSREKSLDQSLQAVARSPAGPWWIVLLATGLAAFGAYSVFEVLYRRI
jgi:Domain of Unknown Function (DUF1206)